MVAKKNQSMLRDERLDEIQRIKKRLKIEYLDGAFPPIGHVYSVMVEELGIKNPDFQGFIDKLNEYIEVGGDGFARIKSKDQLLYTRTAFKFARYLQEEWKGMPEESYEKILKEAYGGCYHY